MSDDRECFVPMGDPEERARIEHDFRLPSAANKCGYGWCLMPKPTRNDFYKRYKECGTADERRGVWADALDSGLWEQGRGCLKNADQFCCLGVVCDLTDPAGWDEAGLWMEEAKAFLAESVKADLDLSTRTGIMDDVTTLVSLNDGCVPLSEIATVIRDAKNNGLLTQ